MARGINKVVLVGNVGLDPAVHHASNGSLIVNLRVATTEQWKDRNTGELQGRTEWHRVVLFGSLAKVAAEHVKTGTQVYIEGRLQTRSWQDSNGVTQYTTEVIAQDMQMLGGRSHSGSQGDDRGDRHAQGNQNGGGYRDNRANNGGGSNRGGNGGGNYQQGARGGNPPREEPPVYDGPAGGGYAQFDDDIPF